MKSLKKLLVLVLALVMCISAISINAFAANFDTKVYVNTRYSDNGSKLILNITTKDACGAMKATLSYPKASLTFDAASSQFGEGAADGKYKLDAENGKVTFVVLAKDVVKTGDTYWADLCFDIIGSGTAQLVLDDIQVCDINENLDDTVAQAIAPITIDAVLNGLGAQFRSADTDVLDAIRFGSKITRTYDTTSYDVPRSVITVNGQPMFAVKCGHIVSFKKNVDSLDQLKGVFDSATGVLKVTEGSKHVNVPSTKVYETNDKYLIYTVAVEFDYDDSVLEQAKAAEVSALPYVIYRAPEGNEYVIQYGDVIERSYNDVKADYDADKLVNGGYNK